MSDVQPAPKLRRVMGYTDLVLFFIITGFGIMWIVKAAEAGPIGIVFWLISGFVFYLPLASSVITLSARCPGEGGLYLWSRNSFGEFAGFITGWCYWVANVQYLSSVLFFIAGTALSFFGDSGEALKESPTYFVTASIIGLVVITVFNVIGLQVGKWINNIGAVGTIVPAIALIVLAALAWMHTGSVTQFTANAFVPKFNLQNALIWSVVVMSLTGLEAAAVLSDEIEDADRRMRPALTIGAVTVLITNIIGTLAVLAVIPAQEISGSLGFMQAYEKAAEGAGVNGLLLIITALIVVGHLGKISAWSATGARLPYVAGLGHALPEAFGRLHPRWQTPYIALVFQSAIVAGLVVLGQAGTTTKSAYDVLISMVLIPTFIPFVYVFAAAWKAQRQSSRHPLRGTLPALGIITTLGALCLSVIPPPDDPHPVLYVSKVVGLAVVLLAAGLVIFLVNKMASNAGR